MNQSNRISHMRYLQEDWNILGLRELKLMGRQGWAGAIRLEPNQLLSCYLAWSQPNFCSNVSIGVDTYHIWECIRLHVDAAIWDQYEFVNCSLVSGMHIVDFWVNTNTFASIENFRWNSWIFVPETIHVHFQLTIFRFCALYAENDLVFWVVKLKKGFEILK